MISLTGSSEVSALWINKTLVSGGLTRDYRVYQSPNYNASVPASLVIALHGLDGNMNTFSNTGFNAVADTANIICIFPQAIADPIVGTAWNSGAGLWWYNPNTSVDDIGFINALIDTAIADYAINTSRVYLCGFSMGGFMTERMALQSNTRIAAFASMSGTIGSNITTFHPGRHVPIAHFHGTADAIVAYTNDLYGLDVDPLINFWVGNNSCSKTPTIYSYPDLANDSITVDRFEYSNGDNQSDVWLYKMNNAGHTVLVQPANDINEQLELWRFLQRHTLVTTGINDRSDFSENIQVFPNPTNNKITITGLSTDISKNTFISVYNIQGQLLLQQVIHWETTEIELGSLAKGIYLLKLNSGNNTAVRKVVKE